MSSHTMPASPLSQSPWGTDVCRRSSVVSAPYGSLGGPRGQPRSPLASSHHSARHASGPAQLPYSQRYWPTQATEDSESPPWANAADKAGRRRSSVHNFSSSGQTPGLGSLVGSFQESLLRGRMSMPASKPVTFEAELGVLGLGRCRPSVRCPPHINVSFPAHFYNLGPITASSSRADPIDGLGSPYVGTIDLDSYYHDQLLAHQISHLGLESASTDLPTFPGYAVPPKGRLQLVVKYPNLNAVKLFLVPYDLTDMPAGTKTFIRQRSVLLHSTTVDSNCSQDRLPQHHRTKETLRFAIHLQFCSPAPISKRSRHGEAGFEASHPSTKPKKAVPPRIYLHKSIRVVFAARALESSDNLVESIETPGQGMDRFATYAGPDEDWHTMVKDVKTQHTVGLEAQQSSVGPGIDIPTPAAATNRNELSCNDEIHGLLPPLNSDPNGERWTQDEPVPHSESQPPSSAPRAAKRDKTESTSMHAGLPWDANRQDGQNSCEPNGRPAMSTWRTLRTSWWGQSVQQQAPESFGSDRPNSRSRRAWSHRARTDALTPEHRSSSPVAKIASPSKAEALMQPIFAQADFDDHLALNTASHRSQPSLLRKLSEQIGRSHSPNLQVARSGRSTVDESIATDESPGSHLEEDFLLR